MNRLLRVCVGTRALRRASLRALAALPALGAASLAACTGAGGDQGSVGHTSTTLVSAGGTPAVLPALNGPINPATIAQAALPLGAVPTDTETGYVPNTQATSYEDLSNGGTITTAGTANYAFGSTPPAGDPTLSATTAWSTAYPTYSTVQIGAPGAGSALQAAATNGLGTVATPPFYLFGSFAFGSTYWNKATQGLPSWLESFLGSATPGQSPPQMNVYSTARARWDADQWPTSGGLLADTPYPAPAAFAAVRDRGARMYCAARSVQKQQAGRRSGLASHRAAHFSLFGAEVDLANIDSTVAVDNPRVYDGGNGAQAFVVPLDLSSQLSLIKINGGGLTFGSVTTPVTFVTADSETLQHSDFQMISGTELHCVNEGPLHYCQYIPTTAEEFVNDNQTALTTEGIFVQGAKTFSANKSFNIAKVGPLYVTANIGITYTDGALTWGKDGVLGYSGTSSILPSRDGWSPAPNTTGVGYHDGSWWPPTDANNFVWQPAVDGVIDHTWQPVPGYSGPEFTWGPVDERAYEDNDKSFSLETSAQATLGLTAGLTLTSGGWTFGISGSGSATASVDAYDMVRDGLYATRTSSSDAPTGVDGITIRPRDVLNLTGEPLAITLTFTSPSIPLIGTISFSQKIWSANPVTLKNVDTDSPGQRPFTEPSYMRIGTGGAQTGDPSSDFYGWTQQPSVSSHLPAGIDNNDYTSSSAEFPSFPESVDACLADTSPLPAPAPTPPPGGTSLPPPLQVSICYAFNTDVLNGSCTSLPTGETTPYRQCLARWAQYVCSLSDNYSGDVEYGLFDPNNSVDVAGLTAAVTDCAQDYVNAGEKSEFTSAIQSIVVPVPCTATGAPLPGSASILGG